LQLITAIGFLSGARDAGGSIGKGLEPLFGNGVFTNDATAECAVVEASEGCVNLVQNAPLVLEYLHIGIDGLSRDVSQVHGCGGSVGVDGDFFLDGLRDVVDFAAGTVAERKEHVAVSISFVGAHEKIFKVLGFPRTWRQEFADPDTESRAKAVPRAIA
jgi:hypothetical protein